MLELGDGKFPPFKTRARVAALRRAGEAPVSGGGAPRDVRLRPSARGRLTRQSTLRDEDRKLRDRIQHLEGQTLTGNTTILKDSPDDFLLRFRWGIRPDVYIIYQNI